MSVTNGYKSKHVEYIDGIIRHAFIAVIGVLMNACTAWLVHFADVRAILVTTNKLDAGGNAYCSKFQLKPVVAFRTWEVMKGFLQL